MQEEARSAPRIRPEEDEPIEIQLMSEQFLDIFEARDISTSGVGIYVPYRFEGCDLKSPVTLVVTLPGVRPFIAKGRVVHRSKTEREFFGVEFIELSKAQYQALASYVAQRLVEERDQAD